MEGDFLCRVGITALKGWRISLSGRGSAVGGAILLPGGVAGNEAHDGDLVGGALLGAGLQALGVETALDPALQSQDVAEASWPQAMRGR